MSDIGRRNFNDRKADADVSHFFSPDWRIGLILARHFLSKAGK
jgi:hypothetical protein